MQNQPTVFPSARKIVVVHKRALVQKYTTVGYNGIRGALRALVLDDQGRGIATKIVLIDNKVPLGGVSATIPRWSGKFKAAVDSICKSKNNPDYVVLLGGPDVIPHIPLRSPWGIDAPFGEERVVDSDLPYASDHPHALDPSKFQDASRKVGRLPDVPGATDPTYLINRIEDSIKTPTLNAKQHFSLSAEVWKGASAEIVTRLFGPGAALHCCPTFGPNWKSTILKKPIQFINCHGDTRKDVFYGERAGVIGPLPHAISAAALTNNVVAGAVVVAECCYGAELFEPMLPHEPQGMALSYLEHGAATFLGSSTISYGGAEAVDLACADELCFFFLEGILSGASCGEALANARYRLVQGQTVLDNYQIKTLAQFMLLGDPARRPVKSRTKLVAAKAGLAMRTKGLSTGRFSITQNPAPQRKFRVLPVAKEAVVSVQASLPSIPMPEGVAYKAKLYSPTGGKANISAPGPQAKKYRSKSQPSSALEESPAAQAVLVVSMPNDPEVISAMRRAWDQAKSGETGKTQRLVREPAAILRRSFIQSKLVALEEAPTAFASSSPSYSEHAYALHQPISTDTSLSPPEGGTPSAVGEEAPPERNRQVAMVARVANGQIQTYKVIVAR